MIDISKTKKYDTFISRNFSKNGALDIGLTANIEGNVFTFWIETKLSESELGKFEDAVSVDIRPYLYLLDEFKFTANNDSLFSNIFKCSIIYIKTLNIFNLSFYFDFIYRESRYIGFIEHDFNLNDIFNKKIFLNINDFKYYLENIEFDKDIWVIYKNESYVFKKKENLFAFEKAGYDFNKINFCNSFDKLIELHDIENGFSEIDFSIELEIVNEISEKSSS